MSKKDFSLKTQFYNWLEQCPLDRWQPVEEKQYTDRKEITIRFKVPDTEDIDKINQMTRDILDIESKIDVVKVVK
jgi:hypothetical protein|tara:strand:- start:121 stop:345 length:225 start_codon:yes stop_codon:yes gene_type:complete